MGQRQVAHGSADPALRALPVWFAQLGLEDLADGRKRKRLAAQFDAARDLVARDPRAAVVLDRGAVRFALRNRNDDGMHALAPACFGHADDSERRAGGEIARASRRARRSKDVWNSVAAGPFINTTIKIY